MSSENLIYQFKILLNEALTFDEKTKHHPTEETLAKYMKCLEVGFKVRRCLDENDSRYTGFSRLIKKGIERAEFLKGKLENGSAGSESLGSTDYESPPPYFFNHNFK